MHGCILNMKIDLLFSSEPIKLNINWVSSSHKKYIIYTIINVQIPIK